MKNIKKEPTNYEKGLQIAQAHHLLGCFFDMVKLIALENATDEIEFDRVSFLCLKIANESQGYFYINKHKKLSKEEWAFVFATAFVILAFGLYKKEKNTTYFQEKTNILFACNYVHETLGFQEIPKEWEGYLKLKQEISFKNEHSVFEQIKENSKYHQYLFNFMNNENYSIQKQTKNSISVSYFHNPQRSFEEEFALNLIEQAKRTVMLRADKNLTEEQMELRKKPIYKAQQWFITNYPLLASLSASFKVLEDGAYCQRHGIEIGAVSAQDKVIIINPGARLSEEGLKFVIAHEILHVALCHMSRKLGRDHLMWNLACDFVINHWLVEMRIGVAPEGVFLDKELANKSADEIYLMISKDVRLRKKMSTLRDKNAGNNYSENGVRNKFNKKNEKSCDMLDEDTRYFSEFEDACKEALLRGMYLQKSIGRGDIPASLEEEIKVINQPAIPWQVELARWMAEKFPLEESKRTYARPSRRQSATPDIARARYVRPEEEKNTRTFGIIMDTSASMDRILLGKCLGAIVSYASAQEVKRVRLVFCDAQAYDEGYIEINQLVNRVKIKGRGGTVLQQAVNYLENIHDFPKEAPILILTDGYFEENLTVKREHAFLVPHKSCLPIKTRGEVFEFK